jgi:hypothetical protein
MLPKKIVVKTHKRVDTSPKVFEAREKNQWKPGSTPYGDYLKSLTPEEYQAHMDDRKMRKTLRQLMTGNIDDSRDFWASAMQMAMGVQLHKAITTGDTSAFVQLWDRTIGKPADTVNMAVQQDDTVDDIVAKLQASATLESIKKDEDGNQEI